MLQRLEQRNQTLSNTSVLNFDKFDLTMTKGKLMFKEEVSGKGCLLPLSKAEDLRAKVALIPMKPSNQTAVQRTRIKLTHDEEEPPINVSVNTAPPTVSTRVVPQKEISLGTSEERRT